MLNYLSITLISCCYLDRCYNESFVEEAVTVASVHAKPHARKVGSFGRAPYSRHLKAIGRQFHQMYVKLRPHSIEIQFHQSCQTLYLNLTKCKETSFGL